MGTFYTHKSYSKADFNFQIIPKGTGITPVKGTMCQFGLCGYNDTYAGQFIAKRDLLSLSLSGSICLTSDEGPLAEREKAA